MGLRIYNTLTREKEEFQPLDQGEVKIYVCGLTTQGYAHLGHARAAVVFDVLRRYFRFLGLEVRSVQNFTDINEKVVAKAEEEGLTPMELADKYLNAYIEDMDKLGIERADYLPRATDHIQEIIKMVEGLIEKGYAYEAEGNVYFRVHSFPDYGKLSRRTLEDLAPGARVEIEEDKENPLDFALWKKVDREGIYWDSPWGPGWPGWHIECSAMAMKYLGETFDIHGGGSDLVFPHHENEIAQSEAFTGSPFARYWMHNGTVNLKGEKMSKSIGNVFLVRELVKRFPPSVIRFFLLSTHYRKPLNFDLEGMEEAQKSLERLLNAVARVEEFTNTHSGERQGSECSGDDNPLQEPLVDLIKKRREEFNAAMDDDLNTALAIGVLHELARDLNRHLTQKEEFTADQLVLLREGGRLLARFLKLLGITPEQANGSFPGLEEELLEIILAVREQARQNKDWEQADWIRDSLQELGIQIIDTPDGPKWELD